MPAKRDKPRGPMLLCATSFAWGAAVLSAGFWFPAIRVATQSCSTGLATECTAREGTRTLVEAQGFEVLYWLAVPSMVSVVVALLLLIALRRRSGLARSLAWIVIGALWVLSAVTGFSVGLWFMPSAVLLTVAAALTHSTLTSEADAPPAPR